MIDLVKINDVFGDRDGRFIKFGEQWLGAYFEGV